MLDEATGRWGIRVNRVEIKAIDPPQSIKDAMEKQMRAERDKRAAILTAEGRRQSQILTAEGDKQGADPARRGAAGRRRSCGRRARRGPSTRSSSAVHRNDPDPKVLAYQYLQMLPQLAHGEGNTFWVIPSEVTSALSGIAQAFGAAGAAAPGQGRGSGLPMSELDGAGLTGRADVNGSGRAADRLQAGEPGPELIVRVVSVRRRAR